MIWEYSVVFMTFNFNYSFIFFLLISLSSPINKAVHNVWREVSGNFLLLFPFLCKICNPTYTFLRCRNDFRTLKQDFLCPLQNLWLLCFGYMILDEMTQRFSLSSFKIVITLIWLWFLMKWFKLIIPAKTEIILIKFTHD